MLLHVHAYLVYWCISLPASDSFVFDFSADVTPCVLPRLCSSAP